MTVHDPPFAVFAPVDVRDADGDWLDPAVLGVVVEAFEAHRVAHVASGVGDLDVPPEVAVGRVREPGRHPAEGRAQLVDRHVIILSVEQLIG